MSFLELVKASSYMLIQDIGSNAFQVKLEEAIYNKYPDKDKFKLNEFVMLLKATSGYFFKFKENALLSMLKTTTFRLAPFASLEQFEDIVWSWGRIGKGDKELWECLEKEIVRRVSQFKPRQLSFMYYSICSTTHSS